MRKVAPAALGIRLYLDKIYDVEVESDVIYGVGGIGYNRQRGSAHDRDLSLLMVHPM